MFEAIAGILGTSGLGAVIGTIGAWVQKREDRKIKQMEYDHDLKRMDFQIQESRLEHEQALALADKEIDKAKTEGEIQQELGELDAFTQSITAGAKETGIAFVDAVRGLMRPIITSYLLIISTVLAIKINTLVGGLGSLPQDDVFVLYSDIINQVLFLTMVAVTWWFGTRPSSKIGR